MAYHDTHVPQRHYIDVPRKVDRSGEAKDPGKRRYYPGLLCLLVVLSLIPGALKYYYFLLEWLQLQHDAASAYSLIASCGKWLLPPLIAIWALVCLPVLVARLLKAASSRVIPTPVAGHQRWQLRGYRRLHLDTEPIL